MSAAFLNPRDLPDLLQQVYGQGLYTQLLAQDWRGRFGKDPQLIMAYAFAALQTQQWPQALDYLSQLQGLGYQPETDILYFQAWAYEELGQRNKARPLYQALAATPSLSLELRRDVGKAFLRLGDRAQALALWDALCTLPEAETLDFLMLGALYQEKGFYLRQAQVYAEARQRGLAHWSLLHHQAQACKMAGQISTALTIYQQLIHNPPADMPLLQAAQLFSEYILCSYFDPELNHARLSALLATWRERFLPSDIPKCSLPLAKPRLKVGFLSADFRQTSLARLLLLLWQHLPDTLDIYLYSATSQPDAVTAQFKDLTPHWRDVAGMRLVELLATLNGDQLDILVDVSGHTSLSYLAVLARATVPVQITGLGFNGPAGLPTLAGRLTDRVCTPSEQETWEEPPLFMRSWIYWPPPPQPVDIQAPSSPPLRLGSTHHLGKLNDRVRDVWATILKRSPSAELHLKHKALNEPAAVATMIQSFVARGIAAERIVCWPASGYQDYLNFYNQIHVYLDSFPCHGGITTCEALWMGVPVVTMDSWMRGGVSLLHQVGLETLVACDDSDYIEKVIGLLDIPWDTAQRQALRQRFLASPIPDGPGLAQEFEEILWQVWQNALP